MHAPDDYYRQNLLYRKYAGFGTNTDSPICVSTTGTSPHNQHRQVLGAASVFHLCKSIVFENTKAPPDVTDCSNPQNSKYYLVVTQYAYKLVRFAKQS